MISRVNSLMHRTLLSLAFLFCFLSSIKSSPIQQIVLSQSSLSSNSNYKSRVPNHLEDVSIDQLLIGLKKHDYSSEDLVRSYLDRIEIFQNDIKMILDINPLAIAEAKLSDKLRIKLEKEKEDIELPLLGIPFIVKGNIAIPTSAGPTTAGSYALLNNTVIAPSIVVEKLLAAGGILLATSNMDEFAEAKGDSPWGWSARGGQMKSIFGKSTATVDDLALANGFGDVCGSSGGSSLSIALGLAAFSLGTQTGVSVIICPAGRASLVGFKPGRGGMTSMKGTIPISKHLDVIGPITRTVSDAQLVWQVIKHPLGWNDDDDEEEILSVVQNRTSKIRVGIPRNVFWDEVGEEMPHITLAMDIFLNHLSQDDRFQIIDKEVKNITAMNLDSRKFLTIITSHELKLGINNYLESWTKSNSSIKSLSDIIAFNLAYPELELPLGPFTEFNHPPSPEESYSDQSSLIGCNEIEVVGWLNSSYVEAKSEVERIGWLDGFQRYFVGDEEEIDIMIIPTEGISGTMASLARVPQITIPLSYYPTSYNINPNATWPLYPYPSMPYGLSILAPRGHESHEYLLEVAKVIEKLIASYSDLGKRSDWMRDNVKDRLYDA